MHFVATQKHLKRISRKLVGGRFILRETPIYNLIHIQPHCMWSLSEKQDADTNIAIKTMQKLLIHGWLEYNRKYPRR